MKIEYQDRIDDYLLNRMSDEERDSFESDLNNDAELKEQKAYTEIIRNATKSRNEKLCRMKEWQNDYGRTAHLSVRRIYWAAGIAAMFIAGFFMLRDFTLTGNQSELGFSHGTGDVTFRGTSNENDMYNLLNRKKYVEALELIDEKIQMLESDSVEIVQNTTMDEEQRAYDLQIIRDRKEELMWLKVNALIGLNKNGEALEFLNGLRNMSDRYRMAADSLYYNIQR